MFANEPLFKMQDGIETRWASPENPEGEKGNGGRENRGRKGAACFPLEPGEYKILAEEKNKSGTIRRIWITISDRTKTLLRGIKLDIFLGRLGQAGNKRPSGRFFRPWPRHHVHLRIGIVYKSRRQKLQLLYTDALQERNENSGYK